MTDRRRPILAFDTNDLEFARGFEVGRIWALIARSDGGAVEEYVHASNVEMIMRIAEASGRRVVSAELGDDWLLVEFAASGDAREQRDTGCARPD
jgi:hypothetical protein